MSKRERANRVTEKRSARYKDVISRLSNITNREAITIFTILIKGDYKAPFLINIRVERRKERLTVLILLDIKCRLSVVIDY